MIGVYEGEAPAGTQSKPWWANCTAVRDDGNAMAECHANYATKRTTHDIEVNITRGSSPMVLVLSAYASVRWRINNTASAKLLKVIISGYHAPDIVGIAPDVPVDAFTHETPLCANCTRAGNFFLAYDRNSADFARAEKLVRDITGLQSINFQGAYKSNRFNVHGSDMPQVQAVATEPFIGRRFEHEALVGGRIISLPKGYWTGLAYSSKPSSRGTDTLAALGRIESARLVDLVAVRVQTARDGQGYPSFPGCQSTDTYKRQVEINDSFGRQNCFEVFDLAEAWKQPLFAAAATKLDQLGVQRSGHVVSSSFHRANMTGSLDLVRYAIPDAALAGIDADWHPARIKLDPAKARFAKEQVNWADSWNQIINQTKY